MKIEVNTKAATTQDFEFIDLIINTETQRKLKRVPEAKGFGVLTACYIDGKFVLVSDYVISDEIYERLKNA